MNFRQILALGIAGVMVLVIVALFSALGVHANAPLAGISIGVVVAAGLVVFVCNNRTWAAARPHLATTGSWLAGITLFFAIPTFLLGMWSPDVKASLDRLIENGKKTIANKLDKGSLKSEPESGVIGVMAEDSGVYDNNLEKVWTIAKGVKVKAADLVGDPASKDHEGMTRVILHNKNGDFAGGNVVNIPSSKINWSGA